MVGPGENAGVVDAGDGVAVAVRIESHNHPSAISPTRGQPPASAASSVTSSPWAPGPVALLGGVHVVDFAQENQIIVCHDAAYSEIFYDGKPPASFMEVDGAKDVGIEFHSLSKTYNMTGWRIGFAVGHKQVLAGLGKVKSNLDSGCFQAIQEAGITALSLDDSVTDGLRKIYQERRDTLVPGLKQLGLEVDPPPAAFYIWVTVPKGYTSTSFTAHLLEKAGIVTTPGNGFGAPGEGYIRMTVCTSKERLAEAVERIKKAGF